MLRLAKIAALISAVVLLNAVTTLLFVQSRVPAVAQLGPPPCVDGDVNGDAGLNIGDPIYLLQHLFQGGPGPVACAQAPTASELETVLAKFFPRHGDRFAYVSPSFTVNFEVHPVATVPPGKILVLTRILRTLEGVDQINGLLLSDGSFPKLLVNGTRLRHRALEPTKLIQPGNPAIAAAFLQPESAPAIVVLSTGDVLTTEGVPNCQLELYGYWADVP